MQTTASKKLMTEYMQIDNELGFCDWAQQAGYDCTRNPDNTFAAPATQSAWIGYSAASKANTRKPVGQQMYAEIKPSSKYAYQISLCRTNACGYPFKVSFCEDKDGYIVLGGIGGRYRKEDVDLFVVEYGQKIIVN
ncbi:hypothetical protein [Pseudomonas sp.]|uniref:hypothetical protein n=1 Tax=Pseudomonas sp. TaxID=306 RepID=UPI00257EB566|nr:hypothetical protein [Pseudomonas sp.]